MFMSLTFPSIGFWMMMFVGDVILITMYGPSNLCTNLLFLPGFIISFRMMTLSPMLNVRVLACLSYSCCCFNCANRMFFLAFCIRPIHAW